MNILFNVFTICLSALLSAFTLAVVVMILAAMVIAIKDAWKGEEKKTVESSAEEDVDAETSKSE